MMGLTRAVTTSFSLRAPLRGRARALRAHATKVVDSHLHVWAPLDPRLPEFPYAQTADGGEDVPPMEGHR